jgi:hypothetical protein
MKAWMVKHFRSTLGTPSKLDLGSVTVIDNTPYNSVNIHWPTKSWHNQDITDWVKSKNQTVNPSAVKTELLRLVNAFHAGTDVYTVEQCVKKLDHVIPRLPP